MTPRGVVTNGIGKRTTAHLNLTRSLADAWGLCDEQRAASRIIHVRPPTPTLTEKPPASTSSKGYYRLKAESGEYLHQSGQAMTVERRYAWIGNIRQLDKIRRALPIASNLKPEAIAS